MLFAIVAGLGPAPLAFPGPQGDIGTMSPPRPLRLLAVLVLASLLLCSCDPTTDDDSAIADDDSAPVDDDTTEDPVLTFVPTIQAPALTLYPVCADGALAEFTAAAIDAPGQSSEGYPSPPPDTLDALQVGITALVSGDVTTAVTALGGASFEACRGVGDESALVVVKPVESGTGQPLVAVRMVDATPVIIGVPHPNYELGTLTESVDLMQALKARALIVAGAHRCANAAASSCDGTTDVCSGADEEAFRESDMAHVVDSLFQVAHEVLIEAYSDAWVVSVHGMEEDGIGLSDGTQEALDDDAAVVQLHEALVAAFPAEDVTSCNEFDGAVVEPRYCGEFNAQGRLANGSSWPCELDPPGSSGTFVHLEQSLAVRAEAERVVQAFAAALGM